MKLSQAWVEEEARRWQEMARGEGIRRGRGKEQVTLRTAGKQDKRGREGALLRLQRLVKRSAAGLGLAMFGGGVRVTSDRRVVERVLEAPRGTALASCLERPEIRGPLLQALLDTQAQLADPDFVLDGVVEEEVVQLLLPRRPPSPVLSLTRVEMEAYFPKLLWDLYQLEGHRTKGTLRMWPKLDSTGRVVAPPTPLAAWDEVVEAILPRLSVRGRRARMEGVQGDWLEKQKSAVCYMFSRMGLDHTKYSLERGVKSEPTRLQEEAEEEQELQVQEWQKQQEKHPTAVH